MGLASQVGHGMEQCGCQLGFLRYAARGGLAESGVKLCGWYVKILLGLAILAGKHEFRYKVYG